MFFLGISSSYLFMYLFGTQMKHSVLACLSLGSRHAISYQAIAIYSPTSPSRLHLRAVLFNLGSSKLRRVQLPASAPPPSLQQAGWGILGMKSTYLQTAKVEKRWGSCFTWGPPMDTDAGLHKQQTAWTQRRRDCTFCFFFIPLPLSIASPLGDAHDAQHHDLAS